MIKQIFLPIILVAAFIIAVGIFVKKSPSINLPGSTNQVESAKKVRLGSKEIEVEVVATNEARAEGLSGRPSLDENSGMLFVFDSASSEPVFWMKDMAFDIDIIWIDNGKIIKIDKNVPSPKGSVPDSGLPRYSPGQPIDYVLEVVAGFSDKNAVKVGDSVTLPTL